MQDIQGRRKVKIFDKSLSTFFLVAVTLASCNSFRSTPAKTPTALMETGISTVSTTAVETKIATPMATPISLATAVFPTAKP